MQKVPFLLLFGTSMHIFPLKYFPVMEFSFFIKQHSVDIIVSENRVTIQANMLGVGFDSGNVRTLGDIKQQQSRSVQCCIADHADAVSQFSRKEPNSHSAGQVQMAAETAGDVYAVDFLELCICAGKQRIDACGDGGDICVYTGNARQKQPA